MEPGQALQAWLRRSPTGPEAPGSAGRVPHTTVPPGPAGARLRNGCPPHLPHALPEEGGPRPGDAPRGHTPWKLQGHGTGRPRLDKDGPGPEDARERLKLTRGPSSGSNNFNPKVAATVVGADPEPTRRWTNSDASGAAESLSEL